MQNILLCYLCFHYLLLKLYIFYGTIVGLIIIIITHGAIPTYTYYINSNCYLTIYFYFQRYLHSEH